VPNNEEPLILSIETATRAGSIAVSRGRRVVSTRTGDATRSHSTDLLDMIRDALEEACGRIQDVLLFAVALGPGSFTGLRIGVATAKGLAATLERRTVGVPTLQAVALAGGACETVAALLPAGRGELFAQSFRVKEGTAPVALDAPTHIAPAALVEKFRHQRVVRWAGEGAHAQAERIRATAYEEGIPFLLEGLEKRPNLNQGWALAAPVNNLAEYVGLLALEKFGRGETSLPQELQAIYVRPSDAELKGTCRT
jgi:tRNA threonylcarbamoyladenosine biosynthesis protein TsaB